MPEFKLKDWYNKEKVFDKETIYVRDTEGNLQPFTHGTGASPDIRYVTFMSYDGLIEYGKKAVAVGDDCADPIARGVFAKPTRESDVQYNYTFYGWATEPNGGADANWNKAITEDKTVYANFSKAVRYYTITYYDGATVLKTESLAYGSTPSYTPIKDGYTFDGWTPDLATVTGNASYTAKWTEKLTFAGSSWAKIREISESGNAASMFAVGDTKDINLTDGQTITVEIADFDHDSAEDGSKIGMSIICRTTPTQTETSFANVRTGLKSTFTNLIPAEIRNVVKAAVKEVDDSISSGTGKTSVAMSFWVPSLAELGFGYGVVTSQEKYCMTLGTKYPVFTTPSESLMKRLDSAGNVATYYTRNHFRMGGGDYVYHSGSDFKTEYSGTRKVLFGFCI